MNKVILSILTLAIICSATSIAQTKNIAFNHVSFKELKEKAAKENKLIFIDAYTSWCGPCKFMSKTVFTNDTVADFYNANFINAKIDMEKGEGIELAKMFDVNCYPTLLYIDSHGNVIHRQSGAMLAPDFIGLGKKSQQTEGTYSYYMKNYENQKNNKDFLKEYIQAQSNTCIEPTEAVSHYFSLQNPEDLIEKNNWEMIQNYTNDMNSREFIYLLDNKEKFEELYGKNSVNQKINEVYKNTLLSIIQSNPFDVAKYKATKEAIEAKNTPDNNKTIFEADLALSIKNHDMDQYIRLATNNVGNYYKNDSKALNSIAWDFFENVTDKTALLKAEEWAKLSTELEANYANMDTYSSLLFKNGKKKPAQDAAKKAIDLAKQEGLSADEYKSTSDLLKQINAMK